jgi:hypothetical protein
VATELSVSLIKSQVGWAYSDGNPVNESENTGNISYSTTLTDGAGSQAADKIYFVAGTLAASGTTQYDIGALTDVFGNALDFARIKVMQLKNTTAVTVTGAIVQVGAAAANPFVNWVGNTDDIVNVRANGCLFLAAPDATGYAVGSGVNLLLTNASGATSATFNLLLVGATA